MDRKYEQFKKPEISSVEAAVDMAILGMRIKRFFGRKSPEMRKVFKEAVGDLKSQPAALMEIIASTVAEFSSLALSFLTEEKGQELKIKQKLSKSIDKIGSQLDQLELLEDYRKLQEEATMEKLSNLSRRERARLSEEEKASFKSSMGSAAEEKRKEARKRVKDFINELLS